MNYPEQQMLKILNRDLLSNPMYVINNLHIYDWESDFLAITRSLYAYEVEVKMSKQDFFNDFKKDKKHKVLKDGIIKVGGVISYPPNYFYYACPPNMIDVNEVPSYAGLIYVDVSKNRKNVVKVAPLIHRQKFDVVGRKLVDKFYYNMITWKKRAISNVYADLAKEREKGVRAGAEAVRKSAWDAFRAQCPHIAFPYGNEFPMCDDHEQDHPMRDCILQCEKGRIFKNVLK